MSNVVADVLAPEAKTEGSQGLMSVGFGGADAGEFVDASGCDSGEGLPRIADKIEYSRLAASEPKLNVGSKLNEELNNGSDDGKGSVAAKMMSHRKITAKKPTHMSSLVEVAEVEKIVKVAIALVEEGRAR